MSWSGRRRQQARRYWAERLPLPCPVCGRPITSEQAWDIGHINPRTTHPEAMWALDNQRPEHASCNRAGGARWTNHHRRTGTTLGW